MVEHVASPATNKSPNATVGPVLFHNGETMFANLSMNKCPGKYKVYIDGDVVIKE